ncbi:MAG: hypothetical protein HY344_04050 [Candidatus Levybacteria bacterium]|nr:hypothetical protein [Candidatus Levybacteria bacterium]
MLKKHLPFVFLIFTLLVVFITNFSPSGFFTGWDNLQTELNPGLNIQRALFSVWQEYQGLGVLAGNAHSADIVRQIFGYLLSFTIPMNFIRQVNVFLMLFIGTLGTYFLTRKLIFENLSEAKGKLLSLFSALFYLLNLSTIQTFYVPFEPFIAHFGFLPLSLFATVNYLKQNTKQSLLILVLINIVSFGQFQVPTMFFVYLLILFTLLLIFNLKEKTKHVFNKSLKILLITLIINSFWILPFVYFFFTNSQVALDAKINEMATDTVIAQNKAFGNIEDVILLKGFWFNNVDPNLSGNFTYMLTQWRNHLSNPGVLAIGLGLFAIVLTGFLSIFKNPKPLVLSLFLLFVLSITMLSINTPPFSFIDALLRKIGLLNEVLRFPFTKFSVLASLCFAVFFGLGIGKILDLLKNRFSKTFPLFIALLLFIFIFPIFTGNLFYIKEKVNIPSDYFSVFEYFKGEDQNTRIANFPQATFWGWSYYSWGYGGSGFLWYGIKQPILDRAFDVWSKYNENYYWESTNALYSKDPKAFENVLNKYQIGFIMVDKNIIYPPSPISLFTNELETLIEEIPSIRKDKTIGNIDIYKVSLKDNPKNFVFTDKNLESVNSYKWQNNDLAYNLLGNYVTKDTDLDYIYPFRTLLSGKNQEDKEFEMEEAVNEVIVKNSLLDTGTYTLNIPSLIENEHFIQAQFITKRDRNGNLVIEAKINSPKVFLNQNGSQKLLYSKSSSIDVFVLLKNYTKSVNLSINGVKKFTIDPKNQNQTLGNTFLLTKETNLLVLSSSDFTQSSQIQPATISSLGEKTQVSVNLNNNSSIEVRVPKINDGYQSFEHSPTLSDISKVYNCDFFRSDNYKAVLDKINEDDGLILSSQNSSACISYLSQNLIHDQGYALFVQNQNIQGRSLHFWLNNEDQKYPVIDTYLDPKNTLSSFIVSPQEEFGRAYSMHFENISLTKEGLENALGKISLYPIPYNFITNLILSKTSSETANKPSFNDVLHPSDYFYLIKDLNTSSKGTLILSQGFDKGWGAYEIDKSDSKIDSFLSQNLPFFFGKKIKDHILVNNWENGWVIDAKEKQDKDLVIIFVPQYFQFLGFGLILASGIFLSAYLFKAKKTKNEAIN